MSYAYVTMGEDHTQVTYLQKDGSVRHAEKT